MNLFYLSVLLIFIILFLAIVIDNKNKTIRKLDPRKNGYSKLIKSVNRGGKIRLSIDGGKPKKYVVHNYGAYSDYVDFFGASSFLSLLTVNEDGKSLLVENGKTKQELIDHFSSLMSQLNSYMSHLYKTLDDPDNNEAMLNAQLEFMFVLEIRNDIMKSNITELQGVIKYEKH